MRNNPRIASLFAGLAAAGVQHRCNWQARRDGKKGAPDVEHLAFVGDGFAPSISTAVLIDYDGDGYGLYFESPTNSIPDDVAAIAKPRPMGDAKPSTPEKLVVVLEGGMVAAVVGTGALVGQKVHVIDYDTDGGDDVEFADIGQCDGTTAEAYLSEIAVELMTITLPEEVADEPVEVAKPADKLREFAEMVARLTASGDEIAPDGDYCPNGFTHDTGDSLDALDSLIRKARELTGIAAKAAEFDWSGPEEGDECDESIWILDPDGGELFEVTSGDDVEERKEIARRMVAKINASADLRASLTEDRDLLDKIEAECATEGH